MTFFDKLIGKKEEADDDGISSLDEVPLNEEKRDMIKGIVDLSETTVKEVMVPRVDVEAFPVDIPRDELVKTLLQIRHSRFPVYQDTIDNIVGVLYVKDLLKFIINGEDFNLADVIRKPFFVPESKRIDTLLREFKRKHIHIAIAIDEYGGMSGIVSMEDIIEEIVGDIQDEFDNEQEDLTTLGDGVYLCDARMGIADLNEKIGTSFSEEDYETLGGLVFDLFGKIPAKFEKVSLDDYDFIVQDMENHKINTVKIVKKKNNDGK